MAESRLIHLLLECEEIVGEAPRRFFQGIVVYADDVEGARSRAAAAMARRGAKIVAVDHEETREIEPASMPYAEGAPSEGVAGLSGRVWVQSRGTDGGLRRLLHWLGW